jgi:hypothetical protein
MRGTSAIDALLAAARADLDRVQPGDLATEIAAGALVVDIRPVDQREQDGGLPGAAVIDRNVLEWRLDPTSPHHIPGSPTPDDASSSSATRATAPAWPPRPFARSGSTVQQTWSAATRHCEQRSHPKAYGAGERTSRSCPPGARLPRSRPRV